MTEVGNAGVLMGADCGLALYKINGRWKINNIFFDKAAETVSGSVNISELPELAEQIQKTFSYKDLETLSKMCNYPVILTHLDGGYTEIKTPQQFLSLGESNVFTERLSEAPDQADVSKLQEFRDGFAAMGGDPGVSLFKAGGYWKIHQIFQ